MRASQALVVLIACTLVAGQPIKQDHLKQPAETVRDLKEIESADAAAVAAHFNGPSENFQMKPGSKPVKGFGFSHDGRGKPWQ
ncbi:unnamed protein product [Tilletia controversa]|uniref:Uncharacterized protein n=3 Tax=Tilletia TaxID=13289 RepID=A0A8X7MSH6_9BASI|nr:hypothetical protein CF336_g5842 [Tilletia laevis]KAE8190727.1 hypothetical protein CF328_g5885 [Tilletia controversa]KAE8254505.1 hypothetical protein A4X03_0g5707 [Tilletia caries]KAE8194787.1 hypothetical protein CF335_g5255 [Tilletia laevis]KAE8247253.1 hypothetical protein A4X06_0g4589 [Tilletia controversa]